MSKALCYINRHAPEGGPEREHLDTRILVVNATPGSSDSDSTSTDTDGMDIDGAASTAAGAAKTGSGNATATGAMRGGYVGLMNCVFAAQKAKVPIDVLTLPPPSTGTSPPIFLQQASHLTEGVYWRWNGKGGILQYLHVRPNPPVFSESGLRGTLPRTLPLVSMTKGWASCNVVSQ
jgi:transcription initiation factor TFIIH subunit 3